MSILERLTPEQRAMIAQIKPVVSVLGLAERILRADDEYKAMHAADVAAALLQAHELLKFYGDANNYDYGDYDADDLIQDPIILDDYGKKARDWLASLSQEPAKDDA